MLGWPHGAVKVKMTRGPLVIPSPSRKRLSTETRMDTLWAPWRLSYVAAAKPPAEGDDCFLCRGLAGDDDRGNLIALRTPRSVVVLNRFPYNNGHLLVAPVRHKGQLAELEPDELLEVMETLR